MTILEAQTQVNYGLFLLKKYLEELDKPISPIYTAMDDACSMNQTITKKPIEKLFTL